MTHAESRANIAHAALAVAGYEVRDDLRAAVTDMLTDLRHLCDQHGVSFDDAVRISGMHHCAETGDDA